MTRTNRTTTRHLFGALLCLSLATSHGVAIDFEWDGGGGDSLWGTAANWDPDLIPGLADSLVLTENSLDGPQTIDLGTTQRISRIVASDVLGTYTFTGSALELFAASGTNALLGDTGGGQMVFDNNLLVAGAGEFLFNVTPTGGKIAINGDISTSATSGTATLMLTSRNLNLAPSVEINGQIRDNVGGANVGLTAGFEADSLNHKGTVAVSGLNTFTGATKVNNATLEFNSIANVGGVANALGQPGLANSRIDIGDKQRHDATLRYVGSGHSSDREIRLMDSNSTGTIDASGTGALSLSGIFSTVSSGSTRTLKLSGNNQDDNTYSGVIGPGAGSGRLDLVKEGLGKWILTGNNTLDGNTLVSAGELVIGAGGAIRSPVTGTGGTVVDVSSGGTLTLDGGTIDTQDLDIASGGALNFRSGAIVLDAGASTFTSDLVIGSVSGGSGGSMTINSSQSGGHVFNAITINDAQDSLTIDGGTTTVNAIDNSNGGTLAMTGGTVVISGGQITTGAGTLDTTINGTGGLTKIGSGTLAMGAVTPGYSGPTNIQGGTLQVASGGRLSDGSHISVASGATLQLLTGSGDAVFGLSGAGHVDIGSAGFVLGNSISPGSAGGVGSFSGTFDGTGSFEKRGLGTFTLEAGSLATHDGFTEIENGELVVNGAIQGTSEVRVVNGPLSSGGKLTINSGGSIVTQSFTGRVLAEAAGNGSLITLNGGSLMTGQLDLANGSTHADSLVWNSGFIQINGPQGVRFGGGIDADSPFKDSLTLDSGKFLDALQKATIASDGTLTIDGGTFQTQLLDNTTGGSFNFEHGTLQFSGDQIFDADYAGQADVNTPLQSGRNLVVFGQATIDTPMVVAGGTVRVSSVINPENLILDHGAFVVTQSDLNVGSNRSMDTSTGMSVQVTSGALNVATTAAYNAIGSTFSAAEASTNDGTLNAIESTFTFDAGLTNNGDIHLINTTISGNVLNSPASSSTLVGINSVSGDYTMSDNSSLQIDIMGSQAGEYDTLMIGGVAMLGGTLQVALQDGFVPSSGDSFAIVSTGGGFGGDFDSLSLPVLSGGLQWSLNPGGNTVFLNVIGDAPDGDFDSDGDVDGDDIDALVTVAAATSNDPSFDLNGDGSVNTADVTEWLAVAGATNLASGNSYLLGDANLDGDVDGVDFEAWSGAKFTETAAWTQGDFDANGFVDGRDFLLWNANKFQSANGVASVVPEPGNGCLIFIVIPFLFRRRSR